MLKSFKSYIKESQDQEMEVLRDLLSSGLISRSEFYTLAKESGVPLQLEDYSYRYHMSLHVFNAKVNPEDIEALVEKKIDELPETEVVLVKAQKVRPLNYHSSSRRYIVDVVSNYEEREFVEELHRHIRETPGFEVHIHWLGRVELH